MASRQDATKSVCALPAEDVGNGAKMEHERELAKLTEKRWFGGGGGEDVPALG